MQPNRTAWLSRLRRHFPEGQVIRYLLTGAWNTLFGYGSFALLTYLLTGVVPFAYMLAAAICTVLNITVSYLSYKAFVFQTKGNWLREYLRCYVVYGSMALVNLALLPVVVWLLNLLFARPPWSPYVAGAILMAGAVILSFVGHKQYTFAEKSKQELPS